MDSISVAENIILEIMNGTFFNLIRSLQKIADARNRKQNGMANYASPSIEVSRSHRTLEEQGMRGDRTKEKRLSK
jgi:hypothetical protein